MTKRLPDASAKSADPYVIQPIDPYRCDVRSLIAASDDYFASLYPAESNHLTDIATLTADHVTFLAVLFDGEAVACGALVRTTPDACELKRMFVSEPHRGRGLGQRVLEALEQIAREERRVIRLETGVKQQEAIALYRRAGYIEIAAFGSYQPDPLSIFMEKKVSSS